MTKTFQLVFQAEPEGGYTVVVPALQGCVTYGATFEEAQKNAREAIGLCLEVLAEEGEDIPETGGTIVGNMEVEFAHA
jgi:predicted RNase H-like HicB family nuclease